MKVNSFLFSFLNSSNTDQLKTYLNLEDEEVLQMLEINEEGPEDMNISPPIEILDITSDHDEEYENLPLTELNLAALPSRISKLISQEDEEQEEVSSNSGSVLIIEHIQQAREASPPPLPFSLTTYLPGTAGRFITIERRQNTRSPSPISISRSEPSTPSIVLNAEEYEYWGTAAEEYDKDEQEMNSYYDDLGIDVNETGYGEYGIYDQDGGK